MGFKTATIANPHKGWLFFDWRLVFAPGPDLTLSALRAEASAAAKEKR